jgi:hypothetical protein
MKINKGYDDNMNQKINWFIEFSVAQKCMHVESELDIRSRPNPDWELVETFFGTMKQANERANKYLAKRLKLK